MFDRNKFKAKVIASGYTIEKLANILGINTATLYRKMNGHSDFSRSEMQIIRQTLSISQQDMDEIFFAPNLAETQVS